MPRRVFVTVAEVSGDQHAAGLIHSLRQLDPTLIVEGHGGRAMAAAGAKIHYETTAGAAMGSAAIWRAYEMWRLFRRTREYFRHSPPDLQICVDSPDTNLHYAKIAHGMGIPVLYYIAPQLWAWREGRIRKMRRWVDHAACILPFEQEYFRRHGVNATFVGHPLFDSLPAQRGPAPGPRFPDRPPVLGLLPGSRRSEAVANFPHLLDCARRIREVFPDVTYLVPTVHATHAFVEERAHDFKGLTYELDAFDRMVPQCDLCLTVSGTATLHVAAYNVPMIIVYRGSPVLWHLIGRWIIKTRTYTLVNLLSDSREHIVTEYIPWYGTNRPVADHAIDFLRHPEKMRAQQEKLSAMVRKLDRPGASMNVARLAMEMMERGNPGNAGSRPAWAASNPRLE